MHGRVIKEVVLGNVYHVLLYTIAYYIISFLNLSKTNVVTAIDHYIPKMLFPFFFFYFFYYIFIFLGPLFIGYKDEKILHKHTTNIFISTTIGFFIFILFPTYVDRSSFQIDKNSIFYLPLSFLYSVDINGLALPSFHCLVSWLIFISVRQTKNISISCKIFFFFISLGICLSTFFLGQHGFIDFPAAILLAELTNASVTKWNLALRLYNFISNYRKNTQ